MSLDGRRYAIAGAGGALGPHVARALVEAGAQVALADRDAELLAPLAAELGDSAMSHAVDLLAAGDAERWAAGTEPVDGLVHLVGGWRGGTPLAEAPDTDWTFMHEAAVRTTQHATRAFRGQLAAAGARGRFLLVSSLQAARPGGQNAAYASAKAAAEAWTLALADDLKGTGATANVVVINALVTPEQRAAAPEKAFKTFQRVEDVAATLAFLCSDAARTMSGQRIVLTGAH